VYSRRPCGGADGSLFAVYFIIAQLLDFSTIPGTETPFFFLLPRRKGERIDNTGGILYTQIQ
jgi:hypothetical protein